MKVIDTWMLVVAGFIPAAVALYLAVLAAAATHYRPQRSERPAAARIDIVVPAHNEAGLIGGCVESLKSQTYPRELFRIVVVADNCTDATAAIAQTAGADLVLFRDAPDARGKGQALRWAIDILLADEPEPDAVVIVDADSTVRRDFLARLVAPFDAGIPVVQAVSALEPNGSAASALRAGAFLLVNLVRPAGRSVLGWPTFLAGNGMLFARAVLAEHRWSAFSSTEDLEYSIDLMIAGVQIGFAADAIVTSESAPNREAAAVQQLRWEGGRAHICRARLPALLGAGVRLRRPGLVVAALDLATPPLALFAAAVGVGIIVGALLVALGAATLVGLVPWLVSTAALSFYVLAGLRIAKAPGSAYKALLRAPLMVLGKPLQFVKVLRFRSDTWVRTERANEYVDRER